MNLDPRTVMILIIIGSSLMGASLLAATRGYLGRIRGGSRWAEATLIQAVGWTLVGPLRGVVPDLVWAVVGHGLLALSLALYLTVLADFTGTRPRPSWVYGTVVIQTVLLTGIVLAGQGGGSRTIVIAACSGALMLGSGRRLLSGKESHLPSHMFTGSMFAICGAMMITRSVYELLRATGLTGGTNSAETMANDFTYLIFYVTSTLLTFGFVLMLSDRDITERRQAEEALHDSLREKEALLKEAHHRVKNNLALIASLMRIEARRSREPETKATLHEMQARIHSVALLNETLYKTGSYATVKLADYLKQIATHAFQGQNADSDAVRLLLDLEPVEVETALAIPCGLILNELVTNSLKHAFNFGGRGEVRVRLRQEKQEVRLSVSDTGSGLPKDFSPENPGSFGLQLVSDLARQLMGRLDIGPGATFAIAFPLRLHETGIIPPAARAMT